MTRNITALWDALGWAILHSLWQGAAIGLIVWAVRALATDRRAWLRYLAGMGGLVAVFVAFLSTFVLLILNRAQGSAPTTFASGVEPGAASDGALSLGALPLQLAQTEINSAGLTMGGMAEFIVPCLGILWTVGFAFLSLQAYRAFATTRWLATQGLDTPSADWTTRFERLIQRSRTHARVRYIISEHVSGPMTLGALRPLVLVPVGFLTALPPAQVEAILLHELAHIRRHDFLFGLIQTAIRTALYFNPAVIMISRQIDEDREKACDDIAVRISGNPGDLVRGLAALRLGHQAPAMVMAADGGPLLTRLNRLMGRPVIRQTSSRLSAAAVSALLLGTAACSTVSMATPPAPPVAPDATLPDTVVRAAPSDTPRAIVIRDSDLPAMPAVPPMPAIPPLPETPVPAFSDYDSREAFEAAMEVWGQQMEVWGENVERRFDGDWSDQMEAWGKDMDAWGEAVEALAAQEEGVSVIHRADYSAKADAIRRSVMHKVESQRHRAESEAHAQRSKAHKEQTKAHKEQPKIHREQTKAHQEQSKIHREQTKAHKEQTEAHKQRTEAHKAQSRAHKEQSDEYQRLKLEHQARQVEHQKRVLEAKAAGRKDYTSSHSTQRITVTSPAARSSSMGKLWTSIRFAPRSWAR